MEGKGLSGIVDGLSTVRLHSHWNIQPVLNILFSRCMRRPWCGAGALHLFRSTLLPNLHPRIRRAVYTPTQIINFALVPPQFRFVFVGVVNLVWSTSSLFLWNCQTDSR
jgi:hypothetical protein